MIITPEQDIEQYTRAGWWGSETLYDVFRAAASTAPEAIALVDPPNRPDFTDGAPVRLTWRDVSDRVDRLCCVLLDAGLRPDDIVVAQLPTTSEFPLVYLACWRLGIIISPVPMQYREHELRQIADHLGASAYIGVRRLGKTCHASVAAALAEGHATLTRTLLFGDNVPSGMTSLDDCLRQPADRERLARHETRHPVDANAIATIIWTSGTESRPKAVPRTHNQWLVSRRLMTDAASLRTGCHILSPRLLSTMGGISGSVVTWLDRAARLVLHQPMTMDVFLQQIRDEQIEFTSAPPAMLHELLKHEALLQGIDFSRLRHIGSGSAALSEDVVRAFRERHGVEILNFFGSSEGASLAATALDLPEPRLRGRYFPRYGSPQCASTQGSARYVETRLIDPGTGETIETGGQAGELCFRGPNVFSGYFNMPEVTTRTFTHDGFYRTGDLFRIAGEHGEYLEFVGRAKDIIVRGGINISAEELESLLISHPAVESAAVVGYPDDKLGEKVCAVIVPAPSAANDPPTLQALCEYLLQVRQVAIFKLPQRLLIVAELPRNPAGKILKAPLRELAQQATDATA
ncbi:short-chain-fatty-acid--CoA ligase FadK [Cupriavidus sp. GA3-3]|uniref:class I adenylate-forming enzyme family protein n=1 Tax=Cupriavidus sp. GA3-3 TaxID=1229514 RepID=UPI00032DCC9E|nr:class I adenylate-forming enzyme family protein [Cupriavidus sp. GA3-3]EON18822.1 short-chain-fatty-acid--CoA ligase FadK [Cupriavidus sp. GA3-3]